jgi:hypothetical protein
MQSYPGSFTTWSPTMPRYLSFSTLVPSQHTVECYYAKVSFVLNLGSFKKWSPTKPGIYRFLSWLFHNMESYYAKVSLVFYLGSFTNISSTMPRYLSNFILVLSQHGIILCQGIFCFLPWFFHNMESYYTKVPFVFCLGSFTTWSPTMPRYF